MFQEGDDGHGVCKKEGSQCQQQSVLVSNSLIFNFRLSQINIYFPNFTLLFSI